MDIRTQDGYGTKKPRGQATTLLDLVSRDEQDNTFFPLNTDISWFTRPEQERTIPVSGCFREFTFKGPAEFGQRFTFELGDYQAGDLIQGLFIQVQLGHWLTARFRDLLRQGKFVYKNTADAWTYSNSLGTTLLEEATLEIDDQVLERITGDSANVISILFPDLNTQIGLSSVQGRLNIADLKALPPTSFFPAEDGWITMPLPFSMLRERIRATFPLISCREGTVRVNVTLKRFDQVVRNLTGLRANCEDTPLGKAIPFLDVDYLLPQEFVETTARTPPGLRNIQLLVNGYFVDGPYREQLLRAPYQKPFREIQQFDFTEPLKYVINKKGSDTITIQLPLEANQPVEEIVWFLRRKAAITQNNNWTNYSATLEKDYNPTLAPLVPLLKRARIQANSIDIIDKDEAWFRSHIGRVHQAGSVSYDSFVYGYSFARHPGEHDPTGSINASRLSSLRLTLDVTPPGGTDDTEWEVHVFVFAWQWLRFENGICNKLFID
jgi:hypothetical protein